MKKNFLVSKPSFTPRHNDVLDMYLADIRKYKVLSDDQVIDLIHQYQTTGSLAARNQVVQSHLLYGVSIAKLFQSSDIELEDLIQEANLGIMDAVEHYDASQKIPFIIYSTTWMANHIKDFCYRYGTILSRNEVHDTPDEDEDYQRVEVEDIPQEHWLRQENEMDERMYHEHLCQTIRQAMEVLSDAEEQIIRLSYGIGCHPEFDDTIAKRLNLGTAEHVRQLREIAERKLYFRMGGGAERLRG